MKMSDRRLQNMLYTAKFSKLPFLLLLKSGGNDLKQSQNVEWYGNKIVELENAVQNDLQNRV